MSKRPEITTDALAPRDLPEITRGATTFKVTIGEWSVLAGSSVVISGSYDKSVRIFDCRSRNFEVDPKP